MAAEGQTDSSNGSIPGMPSTSQPGPPPLPRRPVNNRRSSAYPSRPPPMAYGSMGYGAYGMNSGYGYNMPGSMYGYNRHGAGYPMQMNDDPSSFSRHADESSRGAFQSIENIVNAVASISMMLESSYQAVYNSFHAVIGVADNFSRLRSTLSQVFSIVALFRFFHRMFKRILIWLRLRAPDSENEIWEEIVSDAQKAHSVLSSSVNEKKSSWPIMLFFSIILAGPWLIWKLISKLSLPEASGRHWADGEDDHIVAQALYDFRGMNPGDLVFRKGQVLTIAPKEYQTQAAWLLAAIDPKTVGLIPGNYIRVLGRRRGRKNVPSTTTVGPVHGNDTKPATAPAHETHEKSTDTGLPSMPEQSASSTFLTQSQPVGTGKKTHDRQSTKQSVDRELAEGLTTQSLVPWSKLTALDQSETIQQTLENNSQDNDRDGGNLDGDLQNILDTAFNEASSENTDISNSNQIPKTDT